MWLWRSSSLRWDRHCWTVKGWTRKIRFFCFWIRMRIIRLRVKLRLMTLLKKGCRPKGISKKTTMILRTDIRKNSCQWYSRQKSNRILSTPLGRLSPLTDRIKLMPYSNLSKIWKYPFRKSSFRLKTEKNSSKKYRRRFKTYKRIRLFPMLILTNSYMKSGAETL